MGRGERGGGGGEGGGVGNLVWNKKCHRLYVVQNV